MAWTFYDAAGNNGTVQLGTLGIASGGTGAITAAAALEALGVGVTDSPTFVDLTLTDDLLINSGGIINFDSTDMTITHSSNTLTVAGGTFATAALTATTLVATGTTTFNTVAYTWPGSVAGTAGDMLTSATNGTLSWTTPSAGVGLGMVLALGG